MRSATTFGIDVSDLASARCTNSLLTPTRNRHRLVWSAKAATRIRLAQPASTRCRRIVSSIVRKGSRRSVIHVASPDSGNLSASALAIGSASGSTSAMVSGRGPHRPIALLEQPVRQPGGLLRPSAKLRCADGLSRFATGKEVGGPGGVAGGRCSKVAQQRHLFRWWRGRVERVEQFGKALHAVAFRALTVQHGIGITGCAWCFDGRRVVLRRRRTRYELPASSPCSVNQRVITAS